MGSVKKYKEFVINEEQEFGSTGGAKKLGGLLKNVLGGLVKNISDDLKAPLEDFSKKIKNQKNVDNVIKLVNTYLKDNHDKLETSLQEATTVPEVVTVVEDNLRAIQASIIATTENFGDEKYSFETIFEDAPDRTKKLMTKDGKSFNKNVKKFAGDLVLSFGKKYKMEKSDIEPVDDKTKDEAQKAAIDNTEETPNNENIDYKIFENFDITNIDKLKGDIKMWFDNTIFKNTTKTLKSIKNNKNSGSSEDVDINSKIENIDSEHKDNIKKVISKVLDDKGTVIKVRDFLELDKNNTPL